MTNLEKKQTKRWGKKFIDRRNWHEYGEQLVRRGGFLLDLDWVESWQEELERNRPFWRCLCSRKAFKS